MAKHADIYEDCVSGAWLAAIDRVAKESFGTQDKKGNALAKLVKEVSETYTKERGDAARWSEANRSKAALTARLRFFLPRDLRKVEAPVAELYRRGLLPKRETLRVLDLGAGLGTTTLGMAHTLFRVARELGQKAPTLDVTAVEQDAVALKIFEALARETTSPAGLANEASTIQIRSVQGDIRTKTASLDGTYDVILLGLAVNELWADSETKERISQRAAWLESLASKMSEHAVIIIIEPALYATSRDLQMLRDTLVAANSTLKILGPCVHNNACPMMKGARDWCHGQNPLRLPSELAAVAREAGLRYEGLSYSYLSLGRNVANAHAENTLRIVSDSLLSKGKSEFIGCGVRGLTRLRLLDRNVTNENEAFEALERGDLISVEGAVIEPEKDCKIEPETKIFRNRLVS